MKINFRTLPILAAPFLVSLVSITCPALHADGTLTRLSSPAVTGNNVAIEWNSNGELQAAPTPNGPWTSIDSSTLRHSISSLPISADHRFFRVVDKGIATAPMPLVGGDPTHPFEIDRAFLRKAPTANGNALLELELTPGQAPPTSFPLLSEDQVLVLHDDGQDGDQRAGDGTFTASIRINENEFKAANGFIDSLPADWRVLGNFSGRSLLHGVLPTLFDFEGFARGDKVQVHPSPFEGRGIVPEGSQAVAAAAKSSLKSMATRIETICTTNIDLVPIISFSNILVRLDDRFMTNIDCRTNIVRFTNAYITNINCEPQIIGYGEPRRMTNVECFTVVVDPVPVVGIRTICFTNLSLNPLRFITNVDCVEIIAKTNIATTDVLRAQAAVALECKTNIVVLNDFAPAISNVVCRDVYIAAPGAPTTHIVCVTNVLTDPSPVPIFAQVCTTNLVPNPNPVPVPVIECVTNIAVIPGGEFFTNIMVTNLVLTTNINCTNIVIGGIDTNVITLPIDDVLNRPTFWDKSLLITDLSVVEDPQRTWDPCRPERGTKMGAWTFGRLMADVCNQPASGINPSEFTRRWLRSWQRDLSINFDTVTNRNPEIIAQVLNDWEQASGGPGAPLDLSIAPFRLLAIVNRVDLRANPGYGGTGLDEPCNGPCIGGEGRFVFGLVPGFRRTGGGGGGYGGGGPDVIQSSCDASQFTVIFEYCVPKRTCAEIQSYAMQWYLLNTTSFGPLFNNALQAITDQFAKAGADPTRKPNLSALNQLRANELLREPWDMREWRLFSTDSDAGWLREVTTKQTPDFDLNFSPKITQYALANAGQILAAQHTVPLQFQGEPFLSGDAPMTTRDFFWDGPQPTGTIPTEVRHMFSLNTCSGCHAGETGTPFTHVFPRQSGTQAALSDFLTGRNMPKLDPANHTTRRFFADLKRREDDLLRVINEPCFFQLFHRPTKFQD